MSSMICDAACWLPRHAWVEWVKLTDRQRRSSWAESAVAGCAVSSNVSASWGISRGPGDDYRPLPQPVASIWRKGSYCSVDVFERCLVPDTGATCSAGCTYQVAG